MLAIQRCYEQRPIARDERSPYFHLPMASAACETAAAAVRCLCQVAQAPSGCALMHAEDPFAAFVPLQL